MYGSRITFVMVALASLLPLNLQAQDLEDPCTILLQELAKAQNLEERTEVCEELVDLGEEAAEAVPVLLQWLHECDDERFEALLIETLGAFPSKGADILPSLRKIIETRSDHVQTVAVQSVGMFIDTTPAVVPVLLKTLENPKALLRVYSVEALSKSKQLDPISLPTLERALFDTHPMVRTLAMRALVKVGDKALPILQEMTKQKSEKTRERAFAGLLKLGLAKSRGLQKRIEIYSLFLNTGKTYSYAAQPLLTKIVNDADTTDIKHLSTTIDLNCKKSNTLIPLQTFLGSLMSAVRHRDDKSLLVPTIDRYMDHEDASIRRQAAALIRVVGKAAAPLLPKLIKLIESDKNNLSALYYIRYLGPKAHPALLKLLYHKNAKIRRSVISQLSLLKAHKKKTLEALQQRKLTEKNKQVLQSIEYAVRRLERLPRKPKPMIRRPKPLLPNPKKRRF